MIDLRLGDAYQIVPKMPTGSVEAVITDPPYGVGVQSWDILPPQPFLTECLRVSAGPVLWFGASPPQYLAAMLSLTPAPDRMLVWAPSLSFTHTKANGMFYQWHPIWCWRLPKSQKETHRDVFRHNTAGRRWWNHPHTKPLGLMQDLIRAFTQPGDTVLDPFAGSGTTLVACAETARNGIGIECSEEYHAIGTRRLEECTPLFQSVLFYAV